MKKLFLFLILSTLSTTVFSQHQHGEMDSKMHEAHLKCMEKTGKSMETCMDDKSCKECMQKMEETQMKKNGSKKKK